MYCTPRLFVMSNPSRSLGASDEHQRVGPDYFGYYSCEVINLLSRDDEALPIATRSPKFPESTCENSRGKSTIKHNDSSDSLYSNGVGAGLSDFKKERLRSLLRRSVTDLSSEVNEMLEPVLALHKLQSRLRDERCSSSCTDAVPNNDAVQVPCEKLKGDDNLLCPNKGLKKNEEVNGDLRFLLENDSVQVEEIVKKHSDELSGRLGYMEQQLELLLDTLASKCRPMALGEKQQLQDLIQKLPPRNLDRVVEIVGRSKPMRKQPFDQIYVDLEKEDNITLWRLYYYVKAVEKARALSCTQPDYLNAIKA